MGPWEWRLPCYHKYVTLAGTVGVSAFSLYLPMICVLSCRQNNGCDIIFESQMPAGVDFKRPCSKGGWRRKAVWPAQKPHFSKKLLKQLLSLFDLWRSNCWSLLVLYIHRIKSQSLVVTWASSVTGSGAHCQCVDCSADQHRLMR